MAAPLLHDAGTEVAGVEPRFAVQILPPGMDRSNRALWLAARRRGIGGSDASTLVGLNRYSSRYELWEDKTGRSPLVDEQSEEAEMGVLLEPVVRERFARVAGLTVRTVGLLQSRVWPWMLASPDGLCSDGNGYEGKTTSQWLAADWSGGQVADHAELQAQWCMAVTGLDGWHVAVLIGGQRNAYRFVERDDDLIRLLVAEGEKFWHSNVLGHRVPTVDGSSACTEYLSDRFPAADMDAAVEVDEDERDAIVRDREKYAAAEKAAAADHDGLKNRVRERIGDRERLECEGALIAEWKNTGQFSEKSFRAAEPDLAARYETTRHVAGIDTERLADEHPDIYRRHRARRLTFQD